MYLNRIDELTMPEAIALERYVGSILLLLENNHLQLEAGYLTEGHWQSNLGKLKGTLFRAPFSRNCTQPGFSRVV